MNFLQTFFSWKGRIGRRDFCKGVVFLLVAQAWIMVIMAAPFPNEGYNTLPPFFVLLDHGKNILCLIMLFFLVCKRLHDTGYPAWVAALLFFPPLIPVFVIAGCVNDSEKQENRYGPYPPQPRVQIFGRVGHQWGQEIYEGILESPIASWLILIGGCWLQWFISPFGPLYPVLDVGPWASDGYGWLIRVVSVRQLLFYQLPLLGIFGFLVAHDQLKLNPRGSVSLYKKGMMANAVWVVGGYFLLAFILSWAA